MDNTAWVQGKAQEIRFWHNVANKVGNDAQYHQSLVERADPDRNFDGYIASLASKVIPLETARILDVASGPISCLGWKYNGVRLNITPVDALALEYRGILQGAGIVPAIETVFCEAENLDRHFHNQTFDLIHIRNALDHCHNPVKVLLNCLALLSKPGIFVVSTKINEGELEHYAGLHQWNIQPDGNQVFLWNSKNKIDLELLLPSDCKLEINNTSKQDWMTFSIART